MAHPYQEYEGPKLWRVLDETLAALERNSDVSVSTARHLVVGALANAAARVTIPTLSEAEYSGLINALNEVCHGVAIDDAEFQTRLGLERAELVAVLKKLSKNA